jgi:hypothetical protein
VIAGSPFVVANDGGVATLTLSGAFVPNEAGLARVACAAADALPVAFGSPATSTWRYDRTPDCSRAGFCPILIERSAALPGERASAAVVPTIAAASAASVANVTRREAAGRMVIGTPSTAMSRHPPSGLPRIPDEERPNVSIGRDSGGQSSAARG